MGRSSCPVPSVPEDLHVMSFNMGYIADKDDLSSLSSVYLETRWAKGACLLGTHKRSQHYNVERSIILILGKQF